MTFLPRHQIEEVVLNIQFDDAQLAAREQEDLAEWLHQDLLPAVNGLFTHYAPGSQVLRLPPLQLDCGTLSVDDYRQVIQTQLLDQLTREIKAQLLPIHSEDQIKSAEFTSSVTEYGASYGEDAETSNADHRRSPKESLKATADTLLTFLRTGLLPGYSPRTVHINHKKDPSHSGGNGQGDRSSQLLHHQLWEKLLGANAESSVSSQALCRSSSTEYQDSVASPASIPAEPQPLNGDKAAAFAAEHLAKLLRQSSQRDALVQRLLQQFNAHHWQRLLVQLLPSAASELNAMLNHIQHRQARDAAWAPGWEARIGWGELLHLALSYPPSATVDDLAPGFLVHLANHNPQAARQMLRLWRKGHRFAVEGKPPAAQIEPNSIVKSQSESSSSSEASPYIEATSLTRNAFKTHRFNKYSDVLHPGTAEIPRASVSPKADSMDVSSIKNGSVNKGAIEIGRIDIDQPSLPAAKQALLQGHWNTLAHYWHHLHKSQPQELKTLLTQDELRQQLLSNGPSNLLRAISESINPNLAESVALIAEHLAEVSHLEFDQTLTEGELLSTEGELRSAESELRQLWALATHLLLSQSAADDVTTPMVAVSIPTVGAATPSDQLLQRLCELYARFCHLPAQKLAQHWQKVLGRASQVGEADAQEAGISGAETRAYAGDGVYASDGVYESDIDPEEASTASVKSHHGATPVSTEDLLLARPLESKTKQLDSYKLSSHQKIANPSVTSLAEQDNQDRSTVAASTSLLKSDLDKHPLGREALSLGERREANRTNATLVEGSWLDHGSHQELTNADLRSTAEALLAGDWNRLESQWQQLSETEPALLTELLQTYLPRAELRQALAVDAPFRLIQKIVYFLNPSLATSLHRLQERMAKVPGHRVESRQLWALAIDFCCEGRSAISASISRPPDYQQQEEVAIPLQHLAQRYAQLNHLSAQDLSAQWFSALGLIAEPDGFSNEGILTENSGLRVNPGVADYSAGSTYDEVYIGQLLRQLQSGEVGQNSLPQNVDLLVRLISRFIQEQPGSAAEQRNSFTQAIVQLAPAGTPEQIHYYHQVLAALLRGAEIDLEALRASAIAFVGDTYSSKTENRDARSDDGIATHLVSRSALQSFTEDGALSSIDVFDQSTESSTTIVAQEFDGEWDVQTPEKFIQWCENLHNGQLPWTLLPTSPETLAGIVARYLQVHPRFAEPFRAQFQQSIIQAAPPPAAQGYYYNTLFKGLLAQKTIDLEALHAEAIEKAGLTQSMELDTPAFDSTPAGLSAANISKDGIVLSPAAAVFERATGEDELRSPAVSGEFDHRNHQVQKAASAISVNKIPPSTTITTANPDQQSVASHAKQGIELSEVAEPLSKGIAAGQSDTVSIHAGSESPAGFTVKKGVMQSPADVSLPADLASKKISESRVYAEAVPASLGVETKFQPQPRDSINSDIDTGAQTQALEHEPTKPAASISTSVSGNETKLSENSARDNNNATPASTSSLSTQISEDNSRSPGIDRLQLKNLTSDLGAGASPDKQTTQTTLLALLTEALNSPQHNAQALQRQVQALLQHDPSVRKPWHKALQEERFHPHLIDRVPAHWLHRICEYLGGGRYKAVDRLTRSALQALLILRIDIADPALQQARWRFVLSHTFGAQRNENAEQLLSQLAQQLGQAVKLIEPPHLLKLLRGQYQQPKPADASAVLTSISTQKNSSPTSPAAADRTPWSTELPLNNAGQVLVAPFLPRLFEMLKLTEAGKFLHFQAAERAVHLLQYIVNEQTNAPEYELTLNKVLCGIPTEAPISAGIDITQFERDTIQQMLTSIIAHWKILGSTSVTGLRTTFLQRQAWLRLGEEGWQLQVHPGPFDMLLDHLPWSIALLKTSWMDQPLHVNWRTN